MFIKEVVVVNLWQYSNVKDVVTLGTIKEIKK
jgi:hypothetical protein